MDHSLDLRLIQIWIWKGIAMGIMKVISSRGWTIVPTQEPSTLIWSSDFVMTKILSGPAVSWNWVGAFKTSWKLRMQRAFSEWELWEHCHYVRHSNNTMTWWKLNHRYMSIWWIHFEWEHYHCLKHICIDMCEEWSRIYIWTCIGSCIYRVVSYTCMHYDIYRT